MAKPGDAPYPAANGNPGERIMTTSGRVAFGLMEEVIWGKPAAEVVAELATRAGAERVFLMVSGTLNRETDEIQRVRAALGNKCAAVFDRMPAHTPRQAVIAAVAMARAAKADLIVTIGGGSITDAAKAVQLCLANDVATAEGMDGLRPVKGPDGTMVAPPINPPAVRQISVPTTLSAGEFSALAGVTDERTKVKELIRHPLVIPQAVILDPAITRHTPEWLFLSTGIRAVDHCVEGVCSGESHPYADAQALRGLALLVRGLRQVKANPSDLAARLDCQLGSWLSMGPLASGVPMGASHGIGYVLGAVFDVPHGHTSCIMLPSVMRWNKSANEAKQALVAEAMGEPGADAGDALDRFIAGLGMPRSLSGVGIGAEHYDRIARQAMGTPWVPRNPRPIPGPEQIKEILALAA
jgi:maleylacetate reductase